MMVIWYNDYQNPHTVTMNISGSNVGSTLSFDSAIIFNGPRCTPISEAGTYEYYDGVNLSAKGRVAVGYTYELGTNIDRLAEGNVLPFDGN
jgi:hypothetical protein